MKKFARNCIASSSLIRKFAASVFFIVMNYSASLRTQWRSQNSGMGGISTFSSNKVFDEQKVINKQFCVLLHIVFDHTTYQAIPQNFLTVLRRFHESRPVPAQKGRPPAGRRASWLTEFFVHKTINRLYSKSTE